MSRNGRAQSAASFDEIEVHEAEGELVVPELDPVMDYVASLETFLAPQMSLTWPAAVSRIRAEVEREIDQVGAFRSMVRSGALVCR